MNCDHKKRVARLIEHVHQIGDQIDDAHGVDTPASAEAFDAFIAGSIAAMLRMVHRPKVTLSIGGNEINIGREP